MGVKVGVPEGAAVGDAEGRGVGLPWMYVGLLVGLDDGNGVGTPGR